MLRSSPILLAALIVSACAGRPSSSADSGSAKADALPLLQDNGFPGADGNITRSECVVAIRVDNCCTSPTPTPMSKVENNPCLIPYTQYLYNAIPQGCLDKWPPECALMDCAFSPPPSRSAGWDGYSCEYVDECTPDQLGHSDDCGLGRDMSGCCSCPQAYPGKLFQLDPCLVPMEQSSFPPNCKRPDCAGIACEPCLPPGEPRCEQQGSYFTCLSNSPW